MAYVAGHLSVAALEERYEACEDVTSSRHFQTIWLLAKGHSTGEVAGMTSFGQRWIEQLVERYNALGPSAMGDLRRGNGASAKVLTPALLQGLRTRLADPPPDGGFGRAARWRAGWRTNWDWPRLRRNAAGRRCGRSVGRSRSLGRATRRRRRRWSKRRSKKTR